MAGKRKRTLVRQSYLWHRRIGVLLCVPILLLAVTGFLLNHSEEFELDAIYLTHPSILSWYGMEPRTVPRGIAIGDDWLSVFERQLFINDRPLRKFSSPFVDALAFNDMLVVAEQRELLLFTLDTTVLIEKLGSESLPAGQIVSLGVEQDRLLLDTTSGVFSSGRDVDEFIEDNRPRLPLPSLSSPPKKLADAMIERWRGQGLSVWKLVLDLHSGRAFGKNFGSWLSDIVVACMLLLVVSGLYNWSRHR